MAVKRLFTHWLTQQWARAFDNLVIDTVQKAAAFQGHILVERAALEHLYSALYHLGLACKSPAMTIVFQSAETTIKELAAEHHRLILYMQGKYHVALHKAGINDDTKSRDR